MLLKLLEDFWQLLWRNTATSNRFIFVTVHSFRKHCCSQSQGLGLQKKKETDAYFLMQKQKKTQFRNTDHVNLDCLGWAITRNIMMISQLSETSSSEAPLKGKLYYFVWSSVLKFNIKVPKPLDILQIILTSFPCFCRNSISCCVKVVIEIDFTLWGGFKPRLKEEARSI